MRYSGGCAHLCSAFSPFSSTGQGAHALAEWSRQSTPWCLDAGCEVGGSGSAAPRRKGFVATGEGFVASSKGFVVGKKFVARVSYKGAIETARECRIASERRAA
mmetsp:Transcript_131531/g.293378  ORF Transcript_131531/g.293378 Transcript_131531/m.293378 type:complete len:104 (-) Transcript_131531:231-542(-)